MDYKYKLGEAVLIRNDLKKNKRYDMVSGPYAYDWNNIVNEEMCKHAGELVHISEYRNNQYRLKELDFYWTDEMFVRGNQLFHPMFL